jgi:hypothetical protein
VRALALPITSTSPATTAPVTASPVGVVLTASAADLAALTYGGVVGVSTPAGTVATIQLTASSASLTNLRLEVPCTLVPTLGTGMASVTTTGSGTTATSPSGLTMYAVSLQADLGGTTVTWTPDSPPPAAALGDVSVTSLKVFAAWVSLPSLSASELTESTVFCTP